MTVFEKLLEILEASNLQEVEDWDDSITFRYQGKTWEIKEENIEMIQED